MIDFGDILFGGVLPAVVAAAAMWSGWKLTRHAGVAWLIGLSVGYLAGHWALDARGVGFLAAVAKSFNPHEALPGAWRCRGGCWRVAFTCRA